MPQTIRDLREAGIKIWVLTGDKVETAKNIGFSCRLLTSDTRIFELLEQDTKALQKRLHQVYVAVDQVKGRKALVVSGKTLSLIQNKKPHDLSIVFASVALKCQAVLCCRVSPKQKQQIVALIRSSLPTARTLSIGDGANDVSMITEAHVGVGIRGLEGQQAARASDYAIGEFKHLKKLLFVYGRECYRRNSVMVLYNFWKNILLVLPQFWYALFYSNFSGVTLYEKYMYQLVNILFTSLPIVLYAIWDIEIPHALLLNSADYYKIGLNHAYFNIHSFMFWFLQATTQSFFIAILCSFVEFAPQHDGDFFTFWGYGVFCFMMTQLVANLKIFIISNSFYFFNVFSIIGSFALFLACFAIISSFSSSTHFGLF